MTLAHRMTDGVVVLRPPTTADVPDFIAQHDDISKRYLGDGDMSILPKGTIEVDGMVVGWVDHDHAREWLLPGELNMGYQVASEHRGNGYASRGLRLLLHHLAVDTDWQVATLLIDPDNAPSLALATRLGFIRQPDLDGHPYWKRDLADFIDPTFQRSPDDGRHL
jgi:RimJ/RimL family protein N-acetyltransferase